MPRTPPHLPPFCYFFRYCADSVHCADWNSTSKAIFLDRTRVTQKNEALKMACNAFKRYLKTVNPNKSRKRNEKHKPSVINKT